MIRNFTLYRCMTWFTAHTKIKIINKDYIIIINKVGGIKNCKTANKMLQFDICTVV